MYLLHDSPRIPKELSLSLWDALRDALVSFLLTSGIKAKDTGQHAEEEKAHSEDIDRTET